MKSMVISEIRNPFSLFLSVYFVSNFFFKLLTIPCDFQGLSDIGKLTNPHWCRQAKPPLAVWGLKGRRCDNMANNTGQMRVTLLDFFDTRAASPLSCLQIITTNSETALSLQLSPLTDITSNPLAFLLHICKVFVAAQVSTPERIGSDFDKGLK